MDEPDWAQILSLLYRVGEKVEAPHQLDELPSDHELVQRSELDPAEIKDALVFLRDQGLIEMNVQADTNDTGTEVVSRYRTLQLKPDGFNVAHERELSLQENASNVAVAALTLVLGLTALVQVVVAYAAENLNLLENGVIGLLILIVGVTLYYVYLKLIRAGPLDLQALTKRSNR